MIFEDLDAFIAVAESGSFSKAAARRRISQSSLSKRVQRLEHHLSVALLQRSRNGVQLTEAGTDLLDRARDLMGDWIHLERDFRAGLSTPNGTVRLALTPTTSEFVAPRIFDRCQRELPNVQLDIRVGSTDRVHAWLCSGEFDLALMYNPETGSDFDIHELASEPLYVIGPARDRETGRTIEYPTQYKIGDLATIPLVLWRRPHSIRVLIDRICTQFGFRPNVLVEIDGIPMARGMVEHGHGLAISGYPAMKYEIDSGRFVSVPFSSGMMNWKLCGIVPRENRGVASVRCVFALMKDTVAELIHPGVWRDSTLLDRDGSQRH